MSTSPPTDRRSISGLQPGTGRERRRSVQRPFSSTSRIRTSSIPIQVWTTDITTFGPQTTTLPASIRPGPSRRSTILLRPGSACRPAGPLPGLRLRAIIPPPLPSSTSMADGTTVGTSTAIRTVRAKPSISPLRAIATPRPARRSSSAATATAGPRVLTRRLPTTSCSSWSPTSVRGTTPTAASAPPSAP